MTDRKTKLLLVVIALGLWANAIAPLIHPAPVVAAQDIDLSSIESSLSSIESNLSNIESNLSNIESTVGRIGRGTCSNDKICD